jgi:hypothetical protein
MNPRKSTTWTREELEEAVNNCDNYSDVLRYLNLRTAGGNWKSIKKWIKNYNLDVSHFSSTRKSLEVLKKNRYGRLYTDEEVFSINEEISRGVVKNRAKKCIEYVCKECGNKGVHNDKPLVLQLDHINGIGTDHRKQNLRWLCPNCHSQTDTFSGKRSPTKPCKTCNNPHSKTTDFCSKECTPKINRYKTTNKNCANRCENWPNSNILLEQVKEMGYDSVGRLLGVSGAAVKKRLKKLGMELPKYYTQSHYRLTLTNT